MNRYICDDGNIENGNNINIDTFPSFVGIYSHHVIQKGPLRMEKLYSAR